MTKNIPSYGPARCWRDASGIHFAYDGGAMDCGHSISRRLAPAFLAELDLPAGTTFHDWLRGLDHQGWENLHWLIHARADDNFSWIGTDEIEKLGR
jgi:hypothetical protein